VTGLTRLALAALLWALALGQAGAAPASLVGQLAPDFALRDAAGQPVSLEYFRGARHVVLVFYIGHG
jgi:hypothetical protein